MGKNKNLRICEKYHHNDTKNKSSNTDDVTTKSEVGIINDNGRVVEEEDEEEDMEEDEHLILKSTKHVRHRKRKLYNQVREQMEFYFSDANLTKDRYLMQIIQEDPYVPLEIFLNFNKIKKLIKTTGELIKALSSSKLLELNDNKTRVSRIKPLIINNDENRDEIDSRTIYVESLPANADHEWVKKVFQHSSNNGVVTYVSLPRYKNSKKLKEFGFIEFETIEMAEKCIKTFQEFNGILNYENIEPINLFSIKTYINENNNSNKKQKLFTLNDNNDNDNYEPKNKKMKLNNDENINFQSQLQQKQINNDGNNVNNENDKHDNDDNDDGDDDDDDDDIESLNINSESDKDELNDNELDTNIGQKKKKKKLRKKKKKDKKNNKNLIKSNQITSNTNLSSSSSAPAGAAAISNFESRPFNLDIDLKDLKILPKREWKRLRNKYLNLQREKINNLKKKNWQRNADILKGNSNKKQIAAVKHIGRLNQQIAASATSLQQSNKSMTSSTTSSSNQNVVTIAIPSSTTSPSSSSGVVQLPSGVASSTSSGKCSSSLVTSTTTTTPPPSSASSSSVVASTAAAGVMQTKSINTNNSSNNISSSQQQKHHQHQQHQQQQQQQQLTITNVKNFDLKKSPHMNFYRVNKEIDGALYDEDENDSQSNDTSSLDSPGINSPYSMLLEKRRKLLSPITNSTKTAVEIKRNVILNKGPLFQFEPGIIIKIELNNVIIDIKKFKNDIKQQYNIDDNIKYIDIKEGYNIIYIRCDTAKNSQLLLKKFLLNKIQLKFNNCEILDGTEESKYWDKIMEDRDIKLNKRIKIKTKRGREKIPKLISNHIRFVDDDD